MMSLVEMSTLRTYFNIALTSTQHCTLYSIHTIQTERELAIPDSTGNCH